VNDATRVRQTDGELEAVARGVARPVYCVAIRARTCPWTQYSAVTDTEVRRHCFRSKTGYERAPFSENARIISPTGNYKFYYQLNIGVNAAGVAGVATPNI